MNRRRLFLSAACIALTWNARAFGQAAKPAAKNGFDVALYQAIAGAPGNQFISPFSVSGAFTLLYPGARGATQAELARVFGFDASPSAQIVRTRKLGEAMQSASETEVAVANAAWVEQTMGLLPAYASALHDAGASIDPVDFIRAPDAALAQINAWAALKTHGKIQQIITQPDPSRRLVLTNAVYFKGKWASPFRANATQDGEFYTGAETHVPARLMHQVMAARYFESDGVQVAAFDYEGDAFALAVFLPRARTGLAAFERALTGERLTAHMVRLASAKSPQLAVTLPKVEMNVTYKLIEPLRKVGLGATLSPKADLSGISANNLAISDVIQKTFLAIDEEGTEAAAVTAIDIEVTGSRISPPQPIAFKADHPFFFVLHHKPTGTPLFLGRVATTAA